MMGSPGGSDDKESACTAGDPGSVPGKILWRREWLPTPVFLFGKSHGQRSLAGYSPWGHERVGQDIGTRQQSFKTLVGSIGMSFLPVKHKKLSLDEGKRLKSLGTRSCHC